MSDVLRRLLYGSVAAGFILPLPIIVAQGPGAPSSQTQPGLPAATSPIPPPDAGSKVAFTAKLVNPEAKARKQTATVQVDVHGLLLIDPDGTTGAPAAGEGHLHYQVDNGPIIATTATKLSFHGLAPGKHMIKIVLAGNDHEPVSPAQKLSVMIPPKQGP